MSEICVATIQPENRNDGLRQNLLRADPLVDAAVGAGAKLILCPEFLATGYVFEKVIWDRSESSHGMTVEWLSEKASKHQIYIGASFLERRGEHFINTFVLMDPSGRELGRVYKDHLPFYENHFCKPISGSHIIECDLGKVGVGICFENQRRFLYNEFAGSRPDLILMPHSAPAPRWHPFLENSFKEGISKIPQYYAEAFDVPVLSANKAGSLVSKTPLIPGLKLPLTYIGASAICMPGAAPLQLNNEPGYLIRNVQLSSKQRPKLNSISREFVLEVGPVIKATIPLIWGIEALGRFCYAVSGDRKKAAQKKL